MEILALKKLLDWLFCRELAFPGDRIGLQVASEKAQIKKILVTLDVDSEVLEEAVDKEADLIFSHHPLIYEPLSKITARDRVGKCVITMIKEGICLYVAHTNYDSMKIGLNERIADLLGIEDTSIIEPVARQWYKFVIFVPCEDAEKIRKVMCSHNGGKFEDYSCCTFNIKGQGTFRPSDNADPYIGEPGKLSKVDEIRIECIVEEKDLEDLISNTLNAHPYEVPAYDVYKIENNMDGTGIGRIGKAPKDTTVEMMLEKITDVLGNSNIRWLGPEENMLDKKIEKAAVINGSASSLTPTLIELDAEVIIVGELKYSNLLDLVDAGKTVIEVGHGISEKIAISGISRILKDHFLKNNIDIEVLESKKGFRAWRNYIGR